MRIHTTFLISGILCSLTSACLTGSAQTVFPSISNLVKSNSVVVVGTASTRKLEEHHYTMDLKIERTIRTNTRLPETLSFDQADPCVRSETGNITAVWLLNQGADGRFHLSDDFKDAICAPLQSPFEMAQNSAPSDWTATTADVKDQLASEISWSVHQHQGNGPMMVILNPAFLDDAGDGTRIKLARLLYASATPSEHRIGFINLLASGDISALQEVRELRTIPNSPRVLQLRDKELPISTTGRSTATNGDPWIGLRLSKIVNTDPQVQSILIEILQTSTDTSIQLGAANALAAVHDKRAVAALAPFLGSDNPMLRYAAIGALACFVNAVPTIDPKAKYGGFDLNQPGPLKTDDTALHFAYGAATIKAREAYFKEFWGNWLLQHRDALQQ